MTTKICQCCEREKPLERFATTARGTVRKTCKSCYAGAHRSVDIRAANREFNRIAGWRVTA